MEAICNDLLHKEPEYDIIVRPLENCLFLFKNRLCLSEGRHLLRSTRNAVWRVWQEPCPASVSAKIRECPRGCERRLDHPMCSEHVEGKTEDDCRPHGLDDGLRCTNVVQQSLHILHLAQLYRDACSCNSTCCRRCSERKSSNFGSMVLGSLCRLSH